MRIITTLYLLILCQALSGQVTTCAGASFVIDTVFSDQNPICRGDTVTFYFEWPYEEYMEFDWRTQFPIVKIDGAIEDDTFLQVVLQSDTFNMSVTPKHPCGVKTDFRGSMIVPQVSNFIVELCEGNCFQLADSCYFEQGQYLINTGLRNSNGCDSIVNLDLILFDIFSSPLIDCQPNQDGILFNWQELSGATEYQIFLNRDSFTTTTDNFIFIENIPIDSMVDVKVQPIGACTYLPAEITCTNSISNTNNGFLDSEVVVYPNPTTGKIYIETNLKVESIEVYDVAGRFLQKEKWTSFELVNKGKGIFILKIKTNEGSIVKRVVQN